MRRRGRREYDIRKCTNQTPEESPCPTLLPIPPNRHALALDGGGAKRLDDAVSDLVRHFHEGEPVGDLDGADGARIDAGLIDDRSNEIGGTNVGVATQTPTFAGFPLGVTSGSFDNTFDMTLAASFNSAFLNNGVNLGNIATARATLFNGIAAGQSYLNVHTVQFPGGEIRGQLLPGIPEPAAWTLSIAGLGVAGLSLRRRRRRALVA